MSRETIEFYVSTSGSDLEEGTIQHPFATLHRAQQAVRQYVSQGLSVGVWIRGGTYALSEPLHFGPLDSGSDEATVVYEAYPEESVVLSGGRPLDLDWRKFRDGILMADVPPGIRPDQLFVNDMPYRMARYPKFNENVRIMNGYSADAASKERAARWADPSSGYLHAMHRHLWGDFHYRILGKDEHGEMLLEGGWQNNRRMGMHDQYRYVEHIFEELVAPGEWFHDRTRNILYVYPLGETDLQSARVTFTDNPHLLELVGNREAPVRHITFKGLTFKQTSRTFMENREPLLRSDWTVYRGGAALLSGTEGCGFHNCQFTQLGGNAIVVDGYNRNTLVTGCWFDQIGANGIAFVGRPESVRSPLFEYGERQSLAELDRTPGPRTDDYPASCLVEDCLITRIGQVEKQSAAVQISMSLDIMVRHCTIYEVPRAGINISEGTFGGHVIEYCDVFDTVLETSDHGSINAWGRDRYWLLEDVDMEAINPMETAADDRLPLLDMVRPNVIRHNRLRCDHGWDIDLDDGSTWYELYNNLCLAGGIKLREGFYRVCENNVIVNNTIHPHVWFAGSRDRIRRNILCTPYAPIRVAKPWGTECNRNILHQSGLQQPIPATVLQDLSGRDADSIVTDAQFVDPVAGDYRVHTDSPAIALGFVNFPMDGFGVRLEQLRWIAKPPKLPKLGEITAHTRRRPRRAKWGDCLAKTIVGMGEVSAAGLPSESGVLIETVPEGSWQLANGFEPFDVIVELNGNKIDTIDDLLSFTAQLEQGVSFKVKLYRKQTSVTLRVAMSGPF